MTVLRIVPDIAADNLPQVQRFYAKLFDLEITMDLGWITTLTSGLPSDTQISIATSGGSGAPVPDLSIEVDNVDEVHRIAQRLGYEIRYELTDEPWGVRRFFVVDPTGKLINVLTHVT